MAQQKVDRHAEAVKLFARRAEWLVGKVDGVVVYALVPSRSVPGKFHRVNITTMRCDCPDFTWRSRQLYVMLHLPPWNHSNVGYFQSKTLFHGWNHSSSFAASAQNASGSSTERLYSAS